MGPRLGKDTVVIGAHQKQVGTHRWQGQAYVYTRSGTAWSEQAKLVASDGVEVDNFAGAVALSGDIAVIGAAEKSVGGNLQQGQGYVYVRSGTLWMEQEKLVGSDGATQDYFGSAVGVSGNTVIVGAV